MKLGFPSPGGHSIGLCLRLGRWAGMNALLNYPASHRPEGFATDCLNSTPKSFTLRRVRLTTAAPTSALTALSLADAGIFRIVRYPPLMHVLWSGATGVLYKTLTAYSLGSLFNGSGGQPSALVSLFAANRISRESFD